MTTSAQNAKQKPEQVRENIRTKQQVIGEKTQGQWDFTSVNTLTCKTVMNHQGSTKRKKTFPLGIEILRASPKPKVIAHLTS